MSAVEVLLLCTRVRLATRRSSQWRTRRTVAVAGRRHGVRNTEVAVPRCDGTRRWRHLLVCATVPSADLAHTQIRRRRGAARRAWRSEREVTTAHPQKGNSALRYDAHPSCGGAGVCFAYCDGRSLVVAVSVSYVVAGGETH